MSLIEELLSRPGLSLGLFTVCFMSLTFPFMEYIDQRLNPRFPWTLIAAALLSAASLVLLLVEHL